MPKSITLSTIAPSLVFVASIFCGACAVSTTESVIAKTQHDYRSEPGWEKPPSGCAPGSIETTRFCMVCDSASTTDCRDRCGSGNGEACFFYGQRLQLREHDDRSAINVYERGCDLGSGSSCESLALLLMNGRGRAKDPTGAIAILERMCRARRPHACTLLAEAYLLHSSDASQRAAAMRLLDDSCRSGDPESCQLLGARPKLDGDIELAISEARDRVASCGLGDKSACAVAATLLPQQ